MAICAYKDGEKRIKVCRLTQTILYNNIAHVVGQAICKYFKINLKNHIDWEKFLFFFIKDQ